MKIRIEIKRDLCVGAGACVVLGPDFFKLDDAKKALLKLPDGTWTQGSVEYSDLTDVQVQELLNSAESCPVLAVFVYDENEKLIFPK